MTKAKGVKKGLFFGKFCLFCFPETLVLRFALLPYYQRNAILRVTYSLDDPEGAT